MQANNTSFHNYWEWRIPNIEDMENSIALFVAKYEYFHDKIISEFGPNGFYILLLFALFIFIITIIYIKTVIDTFRFGKKQNSQTDDYNGLFYTYDDEDDENTDDEEERKKREMEKEISKDLIRVSKLTNDYLHLSEEYKRLKSVMKHHAELEYEKMQQWKANIPLSPENLSTQPYDVDSNENDNYLRSMMSLLINMLSRDVSEHKATQVLYHKYSDKKSQEDIMQIVRSVRDFLGLCISGKFDNLPNRNELPSAYEALLALSDGDNSLCLDLLKNLTKHSLDVAEEQSGMLQSFTYAQAANYACLAGNLAGLDDQALAKDSYSLATELSPENVNAWSRMGDSLSAEKSEEKAMIAYQTVLEFGDEAMYGQQIANAKKHLSEYYFKQGISEKAIKLQQESNNYYENYGIGNPLSQTENATVDFLESEDRANIPNHLKKLLEQRNAFHL